MDKTIDYQRLLNSVDEPLVAVDNECRITAFNRAAERFTGLQATEVLDQPCSAVFPSDGGEPVCKINRLMNESDPGARHRVLMQRRNGPPIPVTITTSPLFDGEGNVVGALETVHTMSESERLDEILARERVHKTTILDNLAEGVVTIDKDWRISSFNSAAERMLGVPAAEALGQFCNRVLQADRCQEGCPLALTLEQDSACRDCRVILTHRDGTPLEVSLNSSVLKGADGEALGGILSFRETPELRDLPQEAADQDHFMGIVSRAPAMKRVFRLVKEIADSSSTVLITGESGTGKEVIASTIQELSPRRDRPFIKVNCAVFSEGLLESELFGHVKGAFTDARQDHKGRFELAHGGTLFLDEIGDISPRLQVKLLRVLQEHTFERVGGEETIEVDARVIAATNRDLLRLVQEGKFREDLYYRLNVIPVRIPPLRKRREDIPLLIEHFVRKHRLLSGKSIQSVDQRALAILNGHSWPGNVRQLENTIEFAFARTQGDVLTADLLPPDVRSERRRGPAQGDDRSETEHILEALDRHHWHHGHAAEELGISRTTLWRRMKSLGLQRT